MFFVKLPQIEQIASKPILLRRFFSSKLRSKRVRRTFFLANASDLSSNFDRSCLTVFGVDDLFDCLLTLRSVFNFFGTFGLAGEKCSAVKVWLFVNCILLSGLHVTGKSVEISSFKSTESSWKMSSAS